MKPDHTTSIRARYGQTLITLRSFLLPAVLLAVAVAYMAAPAPAPDSQAAGDTINLPIRVGYDPVTGGVDTSSTIVRLVASGAADSLYGFFNQAHYDANDWPGKRHHNPANLADHTGFARRDDAADVRFRVNGGAWSAWIEDWNDAPEVSIRWRERAYDGASGFGGRYHNVRAAFALPTRLADSDTLYAEFRWNGTEGRRSGYRVIDIDLLGATAGSRMATVAILEDPEEWGPYSAETDSILAGMAAFRARNTLVDFGPNGERESVRASCADCHMIDALDLKTFNYSNEEIVARSRFHELPVADARNIASWIRSIDLDIPDHDFDASGALEGDEIDRETLQLCRPWNPVFQPGPGLDRLPVQQWTCGAGNDAVLENDHLMAEDVATNGGQVAFTGFDAHAIGALYGRPAGDDFEYAINRRQIRLAHALPNWNQWLPRVAMIDLETSMRDYEASCSLPTSWCFRTGDHGRTNDYGGQRAFLSDADKVEMVERQRRNFRGERDQYFTIENLLGPPFHNVTLQEPYASEGFFHQSMRISRAQSAGVYLWWRMHTITWPWLNEYGKRQTAMEISNDIYCDIPNGPSAGGITYELTWPNGSIRTGPTAPGTASEIDYSDTRRSSSLNGDYEPRVSCAEYRSWGTKMGYNAVFAISTHMSGRNGTGNAWDFPGPLAHHTSTELNTYFASIWYEVSVILEGANRETSAGAPNDWNYVQAHVDGVQGPHGSGREQMRAVVTALTMYQQFAGPHRQWRGYEDNYTGRVGVGWFMAWAMGQRAFFVASGAPRALDVFVQKVGERDAGALLGGAYLAYVSEAELYDRARADAMAGVRGPEYPRLEPAGTSFSGAHADPGEWKRPGAFLYAAAGHAAQAGAPAYVVDRVARYGASLFDEPSGWAQYFCDPRSGTPGEGCDDGS